jgi:UDP-N-acetylglucosamine acyltransferase
MSRIHSTAVVAGGATIADDAEIGAYCCIGDDAVIESGVVLHSHVMVTGRTRIGAGTVVYPFASLGQPPQYAGFKRQPSGLEIGRNNVVREYVTMNSGTDTGGVPTRVGSNGYFMVGVHIAHDCRVGDNVIMANNATLASHVTLGDYVIVGGLTALHQNCRVGQHAMIGGCSAVGQDIVPFALAAGNRCRLRGLNIVGLKRRNFKLADIQSLRAAYRRLFLGPGAFTERIELVSNEFHDSPVVMEIMAFITADASRPILTVAADADP